MIELCSVLFPLVCYSHAIGKDFDTVIGGFPVLRFGYFRVGFKVCWHWVINCFGNSLLRNNIPASNLLVGGA